MKPRMFAEPSGRAVSLSVVVVSTRSHSSLRASLNAILANDLRSVEILIVDCCSEEPISDLVDAYPSVRFFHSSRRACVPALAGAGLRHAVGEIIALTDTSCLVGSGWIENIKRAHESESAAIGGSVEPKGRMSLLDWAAYLCDYGQFMHPLKAGPAYVLPGNNISIKHSALARSVHLVKPAFWKTLWCDRLRGGGGELMCEPAIETSFAGSYRMTPFLSKRFKNARCFASMRSNEMTKPKRLLYAAGSPILLAVLLRRAFAAIVPKKRYRRELVRSTPFLVLAFVSWTLGEACGYITGACPGCSQPLEFTSWESTGSLTASA